jgi:DNA-nicking Smr family endonuclease
VRIVHGKGLHSPQGPVLKGMVERLLSQRADVLAYASPPAAHGGTGALLALLARHRPGEQRPERTRPDR